MDHIQKWKDVEWTPELFEEFKEDITPKMVEKLESRGNKLIKVLPTLWFYSAVSENAGGTKWIHLTTPDVREDAEWYNHIKLRRMSSERDWKGDNFHVCPYTEVEDYVVKYFSDEFDDEIL